MPVPLTVERETATVAALDDLAAKAARSRDWLVRRALEDYVAAQASDIAKIEAGLAQADRGEFVADDELDRIEDELRAMS
jgi:predicted transcriptional regulator